MKAMAIDETWEAEHSSSACDEMARVRCVGRNDAEGVYFWANDGARERMMSTRVDLAAAAPELYRALSSMTSALVAESKAHGLPADSGYHVKLALAALKKARGEK